MDIGIETINQIADIPFWLAIFISFFVGFVTSFNPCMIGMASSIIAFHEQSKINKLLPLTLTLMISFTVTLTLLGIISSFFGEKILEWNEQNSAVFHILLAVVFALLGLYVIGLRMRHIFLWLPIKIVSFYAKQNKITAQKQNHLMIKGTFLGTLFGVTPNPCTTPMVLAMIAYTTMTGSIVFGALLLFVFAIGHSIPFLLIGWITGAMKQWKWLLRWQKLFVKGVGFGLILIGLLFFMEK